VGDVMTDVVAAPGGPIALGTDTTARIATHPGGSAGNLAAWLGHLGVATTLVARVGEDAAAWHAEALRRHGVVPALALDAERPTGTVVVLVDPEGERTMLTQRGANLALAPEDLPSPLGRAGDVLHLSGYALLAEGPREAALAALESARATGMEISVDPASAAYLREAGPERFLAWTTGADVLFPNLDEGRALTGEEAPARVAAALLAHAPAVVLKLGPAGALQAVRDEPLLRLPAVAAAAVDATGAGDALAAGWLAAWTRGDPPGARLQAALATAALAVARIGGRPA